MKAAVVTFPGSNCDHDAYHVVSKNVGQPVDFIWQDGLVAYTVIMTQPPAYEPDGAITLATVLLSEV